MRIHPAIKEFYENQGYAVVSYDNFAFIIDKRGYQSITYSTLWHDKPYYFQGDKYSEKEMLKIIKLTTFI